jgi:hypothetical protein
MSGDRQNKSVFAVYSLYLFLHAEHQRQNVGSNNFQIRTTRMKKWPGCSEARYVQAMAVLEKIELINVEQGRCYMDANGETRREGNWITLQPKFLAAADPVVLLDAVELNKLLLNRLPQHICQVLYGANGYTKRVEKLNEIH